MTRRPVSTLRVSTTAALFAAVLAVATPPILTVSPAAAQSVNADSITRSLTPAKTEAAKPLTRSFGKPKPDADTEFLNALANDDVPVTRGLRIDLKSKETREKLDEIVEKKDLPHVDIEIAFDFDSDVIRESSIPDVNELGKALSSEALAEARIVLNGHTDAKGSDAYNQDLSERRAASVRNYLIRTFGIAADRLIAIGYGEERLKNPGQPDAAENRRVEVINLTTG